MKAATNLKRLMPFGKYKGTPIDGIVDFRYLRWVMEEADLRKWGRLEEEIREYLARNGELND